MYYGFINLSLLLYHRYGKNARGGNLWCLDCESEFSEFRKMGEI